MIKPKSPRKWILWAGGHEFVLLAGLFGIAASVLVFVVIGVATLSEGESLAQFDSRFMLALRAAGDPEDPLGPRWLEEAGRDLTALGSTTFLALIVLVSAFYLILLSKWRTALFIVISICSGVGASFLLKSGFDRPRPGLVPHEAEVFTSSFPSSHAMSAAIVFLTLGALLARTHSKRRVRAFLIFSAALLTAMVGISRVYLGVHWPTDVLAGWAAGAAWALATWLLARKLQQRHEIEPETV